MNCYPKDIWSQIEFDKLLGLLATYALSEKAKQQILELQPISDFNTIDQDLSQVEEVRLASLRSEHIPFSVYENIDEDLYLLTKEGYVLTQESLLRIHMVLHSAKAIIDFFNDKSFENFPQLKKIISTNPNAQEALIQFDRIFDAEGEIKPNASPELALIYKSIRSKENELNKTFKSLVTRYKKSGYLAESVESMRHGRRVLSVLVENKRRINGVIHDESATGKTVFIEPNEILAINNELFNLEGEKKKEYYKILKGFCDLMRPMVPDIHGDYEMILALDKVLAKAKFAKSMGGVKPMILNKPHLEFYKAYHPLLLLKNNDLNEKTIPFNLHLQSKNRILILSGPNAGGKSITMKAVGLLQIMTQCGLLIPASSESRVGIFKQFFTDIGDQQSIEDDLSTYSSRLVNMREVLAQTNEQSMVLIDEFGSGTDPKIGGAIAESILKEVNHKKTWGVVTTHYSNIKFFAYQTRGILNGSMNFDTDSLVPTYELKVGKPGSSFAFEIAQKSGIPNGILKYAKYKTGKNQKSVEQLLVDLQSQQQKLVEQSETLKQKEKQLQRLMDQYDAMYKDVEFKRRKIKMENKQRKLTKVHDEQKAIEKLVKEMRLKESSETLQSEVKQRAQEQKALVEEINEIKEEIYYNDKVDPADLVVGGYAKLREGGSIGKILRIEKNKIDLAVGAFTMTLKVRDVVPCAEPIEQNSKKAINTSLNKEKGNFETKIDVRGYQISDAVATVQVFMDEALINNAIDLKIIHGKGTGKLRQAVHRKLKEYNAIKSVGHPEDAYGGEGVTLIKLA